MPKEKTIALLLHPGAKINRSMRLYAERLTRYISLPGVKLKIVELPNPLGLRHFNEVVLPRLLLPSMSADLVHLMDHAHARYLKFLRIPALVTVHDLIVYKVIRHGYPPQVKTRVPLHTRLMYIYNIHGIQHARVVITPSRAVARDIEVYFPGVKPRVVPHGVDLEFFTSLTEEEVKEARQELGELPSSPFLLQISNGFFYKNDQAVLKAWELLSRESPGVHLVRVGPLSPEVKAFAASYPRQIHLFKMVSFVALRYLYRTASLLIHPSWDEGFGWPPLEAMASGLPVICSREGALGEISAPGAAVVDPRDPQGIAAHALELLSNTVLREELIARGRRHARTFTWESTAKAMVQIYQEVLQ